MMRVGTPSSTNKIDTICYVCIFICPCGCDVVIHIVPVELKDTHGSAPTALKHLPHMFSSSRCVKQHETRYDSAITRKEVVQANGHPATVLDESPSTPVLVALLKF